jgi:hypothetical protein
MAYANKKESVRSETQRRRQSYTIIHVENGIVASLSDTERENVVRKCLGEKVLVRAV